MTIQAIRKHRHWLLAAALLLTLTGTGDIQQWEIRAVTRGQAAFEEGPALASPSVAPPITAKPPMRISGWSRSRW